MPKPGKLSPYQAHKAKWSNCRLCSLCDNRKHVVLDRGKKPCDILFIGEGPGDSEDAQGEAFIGPAGHRLNAWIRLAITYSSRETGGRSEGYRLGFTNLVACLPLRGENGKFAPPTSESIQACWPRLVEFVRIVRPKLIVTVGKLATKYVIGQAQFAERGLQPSWIPKDKFMLFADIVHPSAVFQVSIAQQGFADQKAVSRLTEAMEGLYASFKS